MRVSAGLIAAAIVLFGIQVGFSDGASPHIVGLSIGMIPVTVGVVALAVGLVLGLVAGNGRYRVAIGLAGMGTALAVFGILFGTMGPYRRSPLTINEAAMIVASATWLVALVLGARALRDHGRAA